MFHLCIYALSLSLSVVLFVTADPRYLCVDLHAHTLALSVSVSPLPGLSCFPLKRRCAAVIIIIEIQDSIVFGCSHFISVALTRKKKTKTFLENSQSHFRPKMKCRNKHCQSFLPYSNTLGKARSHTLIVELGKGLHSGRL